MQTIETFLIGNTMEPLQRMFRCERKNMLRCPMEELPGVKVPLGWSSGSDGGTFAVCVYVCTRQALSFISLPFFNTLPGILVSSAGSVQVSFPSHCWNGLPGLLFSWSQHVSPAGFAGLCQTRSLRLREAPCTQLWWVGCPGQGWSCPESPWWLCFCRNAACCSCCGSLCVKGHRPVPGQLFQTNYFEVK